MAQRYQDGSTLIANGQAALFLDAMLKPKHSSAGCHKMPSVLVQMKSDVICSQHPAQNFPSYRQSTKNLARWKWCVKEEANA